MVFLSCSPFSFVSHSDSCVIETCLGPGMGLECRSEGKQAEAGGSQEQKESCQSRGRLKSESCQGLPGRSGWSEGKQSAKSGGNEDRKTKTKGQECKCAPEKCAPLKRKGRDQVPRLRK